VCVVTVLRADGVWVVIYLNDHQPAHVFGSDEEKTNLLGADSAPDLVWADAMTRAEVRRAIRLAAGQQAYVLQQWEGMHG
jgi:hypothetical protein